MKEGDNLIFALTKKLHVFNYADTALKHAFTNGHATKITGFLYDSKLNIAFSYSEDTSNNIILYDLNPVTPTDTYITGHS